ncbi:MAG: hypothetical protein N3D85_04865 [Candidatus Bathyarchaeota archaeon]|nr:hypothetical protein [Candidatus Bathyarchaeota archaeon]
MRLDYTFYVLAVVFFSITALSFVLVTEQNGRNLYVMSTAIVGILCGVIGFFMRPKPQTKTTSQETSAAPPQEAPQPTLTVATPAAPSTKTPVVEPQEKPSVVTTDAALELTQIRGISKVRADQLRANGIENLKALSEASPEVLAEKLQVSPKIVKMWIGSAKKLIKSNTV